MAGKGNLKNLKRPWRKGESGNPRGGSKLQRQRVLWKEWLRNLEPEIQAVLERAITDGRLEFKTRLRAAQDLADRLHGRPKQEVEGLFGSEGTIVIYRDKTEDF